MNTELIVDKWTNPYEGIGGWLWFIILGLIFGSVTSILYIYTDLQIYFEPEVWNAITTYGTEAYHPLFLFLIWYESILNTILIIIPIVLLVFMFKKNKNFPLLMIIYLITTFIFSLIDGVLTWEIFTETPFFSDNIQATKSLIIEQNIKYLIANLIWIPYFLKSKRVKATFYGEKIEQPIPKETLEDLEPVIEEKRGFWGWVITIASGLLAFLFVKWLFG